MFLTKFCFLFYFFVKFKISFADNSESFINFSDDVGGPIASYLPNLQFFQFSDFDKNLDVLNSLCRAHIKVYSEKLKSPLAQPSGLWALKSKLSSTDFVMSVLFL